MTHATSVGRLATLLLLAGSLAFAQSPGGPATHLPAGSPALAGYAQPAGRAKVVYARGQIEINADNSSLNEILRDIARATGMKITGSIADVRVFGKYGPAAPAGVLKSLLDGTGVNMLLKETAAGDPAELILSPQDGPPTPPNPAAEQNVADEAEPAADRPMTIEGPGGVQTVVRDINGAPVSAASGALVPAAAPPPPDTPEQIQQRLQRIQQQQQQAIQQRQPASKP